MELFFTIFFEKVYKKKKITFFKKKTERKRGIIAKINQTKGCFSQRLSFFFIAILSINKKAADTREKQIK